MAISRRDALKSLAALSALAATPGLHAEEAAAASAVKPMPMVELGRKKVKVSKFCVGGWHTGQQNKEVAQAIMKRAVELGVNFFDSAHSYPNSEEFIASVFANKRDSVVLMSKSYMRDAAGAERELDESLKRLQTHHVDLWQFHSLNSFQDVEATTQAGGALETARKALADGRVKMLGATSHNSPEAIVELLKRVPEIEVVQFPVNCVDPHWKSFIKTALPVAQEKGISILAMKTAGRGTLMKVGALTKQEVYHYMLSQPITAWVSGVDNVEQLEENIRLLHDFEKMPDEAQVALLTKSQAYQGGKYEDYKNW